jgi:uncharacterized membrane protein
MAETSEQAVIATFENDAAAEQAAHDLREWDKANDDIKLGAIGLVSKNAKGEIQTKNYSARSTGKGAKVGMGLGVLAAVFTGGVSLIPGVVGGAVAGGAAGSLHRKGLGFSDEELQQLSSDLDGGHAALLVMCNDDEVAATSEYLTAAGGKPRAHPISEGDLTEAAKQAEASGGSTPPQAPAGGA